MAQGKQKWPMTVDAHIPLEIWHRESTGDAGKRLRRGTTNTGAAWSCSEKVFQWSNFFLEWMSGSQVFTSWNSQDALGPGSPNTVLSKSVSLWFSLTCYNIWPTEYTRTNIYAHTITEKAGLTDHCKIISHGSKMFTTPSDNTQVYLS